MSSIKAIKMEIDTNVTEILKQAVEGQEIILEPEGECEDGEIEEIVDIIEEIEEIDENEENVEEIKKVEQDEQVEQVEQLEQIEQVEQLEQIEQVEQLEQIEQIEEEIQEQNVIQRTNGTYVYKEVNNMYSEKDIVYTSPQQSTSSQEKSNSQIRYDASADWEDEEYEQEQINSVESIPEEQATNIEEFNTYETYNNGASSEVVDVDESTENSRIQVNYEHNENQEQSVDGDDSQPEVVQNSENNLVYTVLGSKKQNRSTQEDRSEMEFVEVQRFRDDSLPESGTIYYAVNDGDGTYVQAVEADEQQFQYINEEPMEQDNQEWEASNQNVENQEEQPEQDQIFLHEDEDGQLYFKNEHGQLQPVYLTPDGNYAIAENSSDEQDSQEDANQGQEEPAETENYVVPDMDVKPFSSKKQRATQLSRELDDDTVTISLIISEDEHGQKRTQVIIPTPAEAKCETCNKTFKTSLQLLKHNRLKHAREEDITTRNFPCDLCPKTFFDQNSLARHRRTHTESRQFQCLNCHKSFPTANTLRKHLATHNPDSLPLPCIYCGRRFSDKTTLLKHEQSHLAGEKRTHVCDICQKCFSNTTDLCIHKKNHDPDRKFDCEVCGREFNRLNNLQRHMMVHQQQGANEEILSCNVCGITYKFSSSLTRHMVTTHMNPEKLRQQAEEQRRKRENNYRRYLENRKTYETQQPKRGYRRTTDRSVDDQDDEAD